MDDGRRFIGAFPGHVTVTYEGETVRLVVQPLDAGVGQRWEVTLTVEQWGRGLAGETVTSSVFVYQAPVAREG